MYFFLQIARRNYPLASVLPAAFFGRDSLCCSPLSLDPFGFDEGARGAGRAHPTAAADCPARSQVPSPLASAGIIGPKPSKWNCLFQTSSLSQIKFIFKHIHPKYEVTFSIQYPKMNWFLIVITVSTVQKWNGRKSNIHTRSQFNDIFSPGLNWVKNK